MMVMRWSFYSMMILRRGLVVLDVLVYDRSAWLDVFIHDWDRRPISVMVLDVRIWD